MLVAEDQIDTPVVTESQAGQRLDRWLAEVLPQMSRSRLKALLEQGHVRCGDAVVSDASAKVKAGQSYTVGLPPATPAEPEAQAIDLVVVYEDDDLIVIDKPAGMVVHPAPGSRDSTLVNALLAHCSGTLSGIGGVARPGIVHRLDKDTSGLLVAAKNDLAHAGLARQFEEHSLTRAYKALVWGRPVPLEGEITGNIGRSTADRKKMAVVNKGGKEALTRYKVLKLFGETASLVECRLATGRTHQIRVHMTSIGHPLVGDQTYGRSRAAKLRALPAETRTALQDFPRQALHAYLIGFSHPRSGERLTFESGIPADINDLLTKLEGL